MTAPPVTREWSDIWQALKDYLGEQINEYRSLAAECGNDQAGRTEAAMWNALVREGRATLAKMTELEAGR